MRYSIATVCAAVACATVLAGSGRAEEPAGTPDRPFELPIPSTVASDPEAVELARLWVGQERLRVSIRTEALGQPSEWGAVLAELARHLANSYVQSRGVGRTEVLDRIVLGFQTNLGHAPEGLTGQVSQ